jgi:hypothetical protein
MEQKIGQLQTLVINSMLTARNASVNLSNLINFLIERGVVSEREYELFIGEIKRKSELAQEIMRDESLSQEEKIAKAKENGIPEEWVKQPGEASEDTSDESSSGRIIVPRSRIITP